MTLSIGHSKRNRRAAFTLIELILVMVLLVVLVSMVAPSLSGFIRGRSLDSETRRMLALMHVAQSRAVSEGMPVMFWVNSKSGEYGVSEETPAVSTGDPNAEDLKAADNLQLLVLNNGVTAGNSFHNLPAIRFLADGSVDEDSPKMVRINSADGGSLWLMEMKNRTGYEIRDTAN